MPMSQSTKETSEVVQIIPQKCVSKRIGDDEIFVFFQNVDDKRDEIGEKKKKFSTSKDMDMHLTCGWKEHSNRLSEGGPVRKAGRKIEVVTVSKRLTEFSVGWALRRSDIQHSRKNESSDLPEQEAG